eukprot:scaffold137001_cov199-Phaeocystis_antarctica.AAC.1
MGDDSALERAALLSVHRVVSPVSQDTNVCEVLRSLLAGVPTGPGSAGTEAGTRRAQSWPRSSA